MFSSNTNLCVSLLLSGSRLSSLSHCGRVFMWSDCLLEFGTDFLILYMIFFCTRCLVFCGSTSFPWHVFLCVCVCVFVVVFRGSAVRVHDSHAHKKVDVRCLLFIRSCQNHLAKHSERGGGGRRRGRPKKRWKDNIRERTGLELSLIHI